MNTKTVVGALVVLAFVVFGVTLYYSMFDRTEEVPEVVEENVEEGFVPDVINALHQVKGDTHTVAGEIDMPTPCDLLEAEGVVQVREPQADAVTVQFTTTHEGEVCAQMITPVRFKTSFSAGDGAEIKATWNGKAVQLNLIEVGPEDDIDNFELYFKG